MKTFITTLAQAVLLFLLFAVALYWMTGTAYAADARYCSLLGSVYQTAASARDTRRSPDEALKLTRPYADVIPEELRIEIVNQMYFDPRFAIARGEAIRVTVRDACMSPPPEWKPLVAQRGTR